MSRLSKYDGPVLAEIRERIVARRDRAELRGGTHGHARAMELTAVIADLDFLAEPCAVGDPTEPEHNHDECREQPLDAVWYIALCADCLPSLPQPFSSKAERDAWAAAHSATGHDVDVHEEPR